MKMDPLLSLHTYAPVGSLILIAYRHRTNFLTAQPQPCAVLSLVLLPFIEGFTPIRTVIPHIGIGHLVANAMTAFMLNVAAVWLVGVGGGLVLTLAGVFKV